MKIMKKSEIFNLIKYYYKFNKYKYDNNINKNNSNYKNIIINIKKLLYNGKINKNILFSLIAINSEILSISYNFLVNNYSC